MSKCHPALFELGPAWKEAIEAIKALGYHPPAELIQKIEARLTRRLDEIHAKYSGLRQPGPNTFPAQVIWKDVAKVSEPEGVAEWLHFQRHSVPFKVDFEKACQRDLEACQRLLRTQGDLAQLYCGKPIQPFKIDLEHNGFFQAFWGLGVEQLFPEELADVFDWFCPCGGDAHDADALRKQRERFKLSIGS